MPYIITTVDSRCPHGKPFAVHKRDTGRLIGCHRSRKAAQAQVAALHANEKMNTIIRDGRRR